MRVGSYEVLGELGRGGAGLVLKGRAPDGRIVALKLLQKTGSEDAYARFDRERRLLSELREGDGFVPLLDAGTTSSGPFLVTLFVPGGTLRAKLEAGPLEIEEAVDIVTQLARALGRAHAKGVVHRDVKPENVLFSEKGRPLLTDLGLAKHFRMDVSGASLSVQLSQGDSWRGTLGYMAPEQLQNATAAGPQADVFALGAILHECLTGQPAFANDSVQSALSSIEECKPKPVRSLRKDVPAWLAAVVAKALSRDPDERFEDGDALADALENPVAEKSRLPLLLGGALVVLLAGGIVFGKKLLQKAPLAFLELEPANGSTVVTSREVVVKGRLSDPGAGPVLIENKEVALDAQGRFSMKLDVTSSRTIEVRAGALLSRIVVEVDADVPEVVIDAIAPAGEKLEVGCRVIDSHARLARFSLLDAGGNVIARSESRIVVERADASFSLPENARTVVVEGEDFAGRTARVERKIVRMPQNLRLARPGVFAWKLPDESDLELVWVPAGEFVMGADERPIDPWSESHELPRHRRTIEGFWIGRTHVTWTQYLAFARATNRALPQRPVWAKDDHPVVYVSWEDSKAFCDWAKLVLPTEAEWEKAARGTDGRRYPWGNAPWNGKQANLSDASILSYPDMVKNFRQRNWLETEIDDGFAFTSPVGKFAEGISPVGALDMAGNAWQWCSDPLDERAYARFISQEPPVRENGSRVMRGGAWFTPNQDGRSPHRAGGPQTIKAEGIGFRAALRP